MAREAEPFELVMIGQAPGKHPRHDPDKHALFPYPPRCSGDRLMKLMGLGPRDYIAITRRNVFREYPGSSGKGDKFPIKEARRRAQLLLPELEGKHVLFVGKKVGEVFGFFSRHPIDRGEDADRMLVWTPASLFGFEMTAACVPHPSGLNQWWNIKNNRSRGETFLTDVGDRHKKFLQHVAGMGG